MKHMDFPCKHSVCIVSFRWEEVRKSGSIANKNVTLSKTDTLNRFIRDNTRKIRNSQPPYIQRFAVRCLFVDEFNITNKVFCFSASLFSR